jgi:uncharacterized protein (TIGR02246 family)
MTEGPPLTADDRFAIMDLMLAYGRALDTKDAAAYAAVFAPDGIRVSGNGQRIQRGRAAIQAEVERTFSTWKASVRHFMTPSTVEGDGTRCTVRTYGQACVEQAEGPVQIAAVDEYQDICVKLEGHWYFQERRIVNLLEDRGAPLRKS